MRSRTSHEQINRTTENGLIDRFGRFGFGMSFGRQFRGATRPRGFGSIRGPNTIVCCPPSLPPDQDRYCAAAITFQVCSRTRFSASSDTTMRMIPRGINVAANQSTTVAVAVESNSGNVIVHRTAGRGGVCPAENEGGRGVSGPRRWGAGMLPVHTVPGSETRNASPIMIIPIRGRGTAVDPPHV